MSEDLPARKRLRLKEYDYSQAGAYFITICVKDRHELLGTIYENSVNNEVSDVGDAVLCVPPLPNPPLGIELSDIGKKAEEYLELMDISPHSVRLDNFVIMPNHVHLLVTLIDATQENGTQRTASPTTVSHVIASPTKAVIPQIVHGLKSHITKYVGESIWQRSYHDHIVRNDAEYNRIWNYIDNNVQSWKDDILYKEIN
jgi:putative transposase